MEGKSNRPGLVGLRHVAVWVEDVARSLGFYRDVLGMELEWMPDPDNAYLTSGTDNLALHRREGSEQVRKAPVLDHIGFAVARPEDVDEWARHLEARQIPLVKEPKTHRDGARSLYLEDPDGILIQIIYHPPISTVSASRSRQ
jgi:catechol 2,3-dioxygenase-like lactoylglutathione lyase family enzyme